MRPLQIELENFLSHRGPTTVNLADLSAVAIVGENGSGKSSLVDAITWALFARGRGRGPDDYVHADATRCRVRVDFELDGQRYAVERQRERGAGGKSYLGLFARTDEWHPVGSDSIALTQAAIEDLLGMSGDLWEATSFIGQGKADAFTQLKPAARKELLTELLELDRYVAYAERARGLSREAAARLSTIVAGVQSLGDVDETLTVTDETIADREQSASDARQVAEALTVEMTALRDQLKAREINMAHAVGLARELEQLREARRAAAQTNEAEVARLDQDLRLAESAERLATSDLERARSIAEELPTLERKVIELGATKDELEEGISALTTQLSEKHELYTRHSDARLALDDDRVSVAERIALLEKDGGECYACGTELGPDKRDTLIESLFAERGRIDARYEELGTEAQEAANAGATIKARLEGLRASLPQARADHEDATGRHARASAQGEDLPSIEERHAQAKGRLKAALEATRTRIGQQVKDLEPSPREVELAEQLQSMDDLETAITSIRVALAEKEVNLSEVAREREKLAAELGGLAEARRRLVDQMGELEVLERDRERYTRIRGELDIIAEAYGRDGIPTLIIEQAIPALEDEANRLLHKITGGRFTLRIDSLRVLKSGGMKESLEVIVADEVSERPLEALSGGERQCVDLSLRISLARLLAHRAGRSIETLIIDEGFTALDVVHRQRTIEVLHELLEEFTCVLFVTHLQELADAFPARLEITRDENGSHVNAGVPEAVSA